MDLLGLLKGIAENPETADKVKGTKSPQDVVELVKEHGLEIAVEEVHKLLSDKSHGGMLDHLMEAFTGGGSEADPE